MDQKNFRAYDKVVEGLDLHQQNLIRRSGPIIRPVTPHYRGKHNPKIKEEGLSRDLLPCPLPVRRRR